MNPIKNAYTEGWRDRHLLEQLPEDALSVALEKEWLRSDASAFLDSIENKWEWRYERQLKRIRELENLITKLKKELKPLKLQGT